MATRSDDVEILVHITAPSRVADDAQYRQLAEAYLDFVPQRKIVLPSIEDDKPGGDALEYNQNQPLLLDDGDPPAVPLSSSQEYATPAPMPLILDSQDLSFQSALDNRESPRLAETTFGVTLNLDTTPMHDDGPASQHSWRAPPSEIGDSYPMPDPGLLRMSPSRLLEHYVRTSGLQTNDVLNPKSPARSIPQPSKHIEVPSSPLEGLAFEKSTSQSEPPPISIIPSSPPLPASDIKIVPFSPERGPAERSPVVVPTSDNAFDVTHISSSSIDAPGAAPSQKPPVTLYSDDFVDITHISGSLVANDSDEVASHAQAALPEVQQDEHDVTHVTDSFTRDPTGLLDNEGEITQPLIEEAQDVTHISMSSVDSGEGAAPMQERDDPADPVVALDAVHVGGGSPKGIAAAHEKDYTSPPAKRRRRSQDSVSSAVTSPEAGNLLAQSRSPPNSDIRARVTHSLEIIPSSPPAGIEVLKPDDLVPPQFAKLANDLSARYRPLAPKRELDPLERGYWLVDCESWSEASRSSTWAFLERYIRSGLAGWGVWCRREKEPHRLVRVYCWGHVVKHAYLLLYLASERKLKGTGASWIDADGDIMIEVPSHAK